MECPINLFHGFITNIIDPNNVWIRFGTDHDIQLYVEYQKKLDAFYNENDQIYACNGESLYTNAYVVVADDAEIETYEKNTHYHWRRAQVAQWDKETDTVDVFFIDLGYSAIVKRSQLRLGLPNLFHILPSQAISVSLAYIKPLAQSWTSRAKNFLELKVLNRSVLVSFVTQDETSGHHAIAVYTQTSEEKWHSLIHEMEMEELALAALSVRQSFDFLFVIFALRVHMTVTPNLKCYPQLVENIMPEFMSQEEANTCLQVMNNLQRQREMLSREEGDVTEACEVGISDEDGMAATNHLQKQQPSDSPQCSSYTEPPKCLEKDMESAQDVVSHMDYDSLAQRTSYSISKFQQDRQNEMKRKEIDRIMSTLHPDNADVASVSEDQDWDTVRDIDALDDIQCQIYKNVQRQTSDGENSQFTREIEMLERGKPIQDANIEGYQVKPDPKKNKIETARESPGRSDTPSNDKALKEIENYEIIKKIQKILRGHDNRDSDIVSASIHSIVEPDVEVSSEELSIVIYALLDHTINKTIQEQEMALCILETYSDTSSFLPAMHNVLLQLKDERVRHVNSIRQDAKHQEFAKMLSLIFTYSNDWDERSAKDIQEFILCFVSNWIIFNKNRNQTGSLIFDSELMFLECAEVVLYQCLDDLKEKFPESFGDMMAEIRCKLVHELSPRWIRERLLDLLLNMNCDSNAFRQGTKTTNRSTQTAREKANVVDYGRVSPAYFERDWRSAEKWTRNSHSSQTNVLEARDSMAVLGDSHAASSTSHLFCQSNLTPSLARDSSVPFETIHDSDEWPQTPKEDTAMGTSVSSYYSAEASVGALRSIEAENDASDQADMTPISPSFELKAQYVPAEARSRPRRRGVPKSIRQLSPRLLRRICQEDLNDGSSLPLNLDETTLLDGSSDSPALFHSYLSSDQSCTSDQLSSLVRESTTSAAGRDIPSECDECLETSIGNVAFTNTLAMSGASFNESSQDGVNRSINQMQDSDLSSFHETAEEEEQSKYFQPPSANSPNGYKIRNGYSANNEFPVDIVDSVNIEQSDEIDNSTKVINHENFIYSDKIVDSVNIDDYTNFDNRDGIVDHAVNIDNLSNNLPPDSEADNADESKEEEQVYRGSEVDKSIPQIKYTSGRLKEMNPNKNLPPVPLEELWEPIELVTRMITQKNARQKMRMGTVEEELNTNPGLFDRSHELSRKSPSNARGLNTSPGLFNRSDELSRKSPSIADKSVRESVQGTHVTSDVLNLQSPEQEENVAQIYVPDDVTDMRGDSRGLGQDAILSAASESKHESESCSKAEDVEEEETWHEDSSKENMESLSGRGKGKKKKIKFRPLDFFKSRVPVAHDGTGDDEFDEFGPEALQMYESLEKEERQRELLESVGDGDILTHTRFGGSAVTNPKRPSLFAEVRQHYQPPKPSKPWCPGKRKCTRCGSEDHTVYNCDKDSSSLYKC